MQFDLDKVRAVFPSVDENVAQLEKIQGHKYRNRALAAQALFHSSALVHWPRDKSGVRSNESLEFLGDSFLNFAIARELMHRYPDAQEGILSKMRAAIVGTGNLIRIASKLNLGECVLLGRGELNDARNANHSFLADAFEATLAALLLDSSEDIARAWVLTCFDGELSLGNELLKNADAKSQFQEWLQAFVNITPQYELIETLEAVDGPQFVIACRIQGIDYAQAQARNKREASHLVAEEMLRRVAAGELTREMILGTLK